MAKTNIHFKNGEHIELPIVAEKNIFETALNGPVKISFDDEEKHKEVWIKVEDVLYIVVTT